MNMLNTVIKKSQATHYSLNKSVDRTINNSEIEDASFKPGKSRVKQSLHNSRKTVRKCGSCQVLKSKKGSNSCSVNMSTKNKEKHDENMTKLKKLSSRMIPKVSSQWLFERKSKIHHFWLILLIFYLAIRIECKPNFLD